MSDRREKEYLTDSCHLHLPCPSKSRCSAKSHSSSCLSSQYENQYYEASERGPLWFTKEDNEFPRLLTTPPSSSKEPDLLDHVVKIKRKKKRKRKKKVFAIDMTGTGSGKVHKCRRGSGGVCRRQRLHSEDSSNRRSSGVTREFEQSKKARLAVVVVAFSLIMLSFFLVGLTLRMAPIIDELVRKGNEEIYRSMTAGASTSPPTLEGAVAANNTTSTASSPPG